MNMGNAEMVVVPAAEAVASIVGKTDGLSLLAIIVVSKAISPATVSSQEEDHTGPGTMVAT